MAITKLKQHLVAHGHLQYLQVGRLTGNSIGGHIKLSAQSVATKQLKAIGNELSVAAPSTLGAVSLATPSGASQTAERRFAYTKLAFFIATPPVRHRPLTRLVDLVIAAGAPVQATPVSTGLRSPNSSPPMIW